MNKNNYLENVLQSHKMSHVDDILAKHKNKRDDIKNALEEKFKDEIVTRAINSGSYAKHDAINIKYDLDICQPFKRNSFATLGDMADAVHNYFNDEYEDDELLHNKIRKQRVSVGLTFLVDNHEIQIDIVPGREVTQDDYIETNRLNLYVRPTLLEAASSTQTNIQKHIDLVKGKGDERNAIRLLKAWKVHSNKSIKSFLIELITFRAFDNCSEISVGHWGKLKMVMEFILDNIQTIRLEDPANSNNIVSDTMSLTEKQQLGSDMEFILDQIENSDDNLKYYFPINQEFFDEEKDKKKAAALEIARSGVISKPWCKSNGTSST
jgi:hypothetical protein